MKSLIVIILTSLLYPYTTTAQTSPINRNLFFLDDKVIEVNLSTDIKKLRIEKKVPVWQPANITMTFTDSQVIAEQIRVQPRGEYRKNNCDIAALMLNFKNTTSPTLSPLKKLKMVGGCRTGRIAEELVLKEYLTYKIYNLLTLMSFQVRLLYINYKDSKQKNKPYSQYAFLIEDMSDLSSRNNCKEVKGKTYLTEATNRKQMTLVALFQYMIGNTDWVVPKYHNVKLMVPKNDTIAAPYVLPYDFDYAGVVDAGYAIPHEDLGIESVRERLYRGYGRTMPELQEAIEIFKEKKSRIMYTIENFDLLNSKTRQQMTGYIEEFYKIIDDKNMVRSVFINNARSRL